MGRIGGDCLWYAKEDGVLPESLDEIEIQAWEPGINPKSKSWWGSENEGLVYLGKGMTTDMQPNLPVIVTPRPFSSSVCYLVYRLDGKTDKLDPIAFRKVMDEWRSEMSKRSKATTSTK